MAAVTRQLFFANLLYRESRFEAIKNLNGLDRTE